MCTLCESMRLEVIDMAIGYEKPLLEGINIKLEKPLLLQVIGPNGAGKTTFLKTLAGLVRPLKGQVLVNGVKATANPEVAGKFMAFLPQLATTKQVGLLPISVWEFVEVGVRLCHRKKGKEISREELRNSVREALKHVELEPSVWNKNMWRLSGGQRQRALIARVIACDAPILLLDEPFSSLDPEGKFDIAHLLGGLRKEKIVIATCHDPELLMVQTDLIMFMGRGFYIVGKPSEVLRGDVLRKVYGESIVEFADHIHICDFHA
uniref:Metal ABC transporter ATP-binding protein n=1 Tax=Ignisphaera aggregans TaxID=334771 RepID=A0A7C4BD21_9CREN